MKKISILLLLFLLFFGAKHNAYSQHFDSFGTTVHEYTGDIQSVSNQYSGTSNLFQKHISDDDAWDILVDDSPNGKGVCMNCGEYTIDRNDGICHVCGLEYGADGILIGETSIGSGCYALLACSLLYVLLIRTRARKRSWLS